MRNAILIGFEYKTSNKQKKLPGICVDLYLVFSFLKKLNWKDSEIKVFTDIKKDEKTEVLKSALLEKTVDSNILTFIEDLKEKNQYIEFKHVNHYNNFTSLFQDISSKTFVYYSGHSKKENLILPNDSLISLDSFRDNIKSEEIFLVMDCCQGGIKLPFVLNENFYRLHNEKSFVKSEIICISSSLNDENSLISKKGSLFTKNLFSILSENKELKIIKNKLKLGKFSVSHPNLYHVFNWFYKEINIKIIFNGSFITVIR